MATGTVPKRSGVGAIPDRIHARQNTDNEGGVTCVHCVSTRYNSLILYLKFSPL